MGLNKERCRPSVCLAIPTLVQIIKDSQLSTHPHDQEEFAFKVSAKCCSLVMAPIANMLSESHNVDVLAEISNLSQQESYLDSTSDKQTPLAAHDPHSLLKQYMFPLYILGLLAVQLQSEQHPSLHNLEANSISPVKTCRHSLKPKDLTPLSQKDNAERSPDQRCLVSAAGLLQDGEGRDKTIDTIDSLGITAPEDRLKMRPDFMMVGRTTDDLGGKEGRVTKRF